jgi:hypothetical protein
LAFLSLLTTKDVFEEVKLGLIGWFDEGVHGLLGRTIYSSIDSKDFRF